MPHGDVLVDCLFGTGLSRGLGDADSARLMALAGFHEYTGPRTPTYPSRLPLTQLDHVYARGLRPVSTLVPQGRIWRQMSDHLPLVAEFTWLD